MENTHASVLECTPDVTLHYNYYVINPPTFLSLKWKCLLWGLSKHCFRTIELTVRPTLIEFWILSIVSMKCLKHVKDYNKLMLASTLCNITSSFTKSQSNLHISHPPPCLLPNFSLPPPPPLLCHNAQLPLPPNCQSHLSLLPPQHSTRH